MSKLSTKIPKILIMGIKKGQISWDGFKKWVVNILFCDKISLLGDKKRGYDLYWGFFLGNMSC
jgi:hypothetical protein